MKTSFVLAGTLSLLFLASCGTAPTPPAQTGTPVPVVNYPTSQSDTPATKFCIENGGTVSIEANPEGTDMAYCTLKTGEKIDAWKYMNDDTEKKGNQ